MLAADVVAAEQVPPFANSAVDGYAVRAADVAAAAGRARRSWPRWRRAPSTDRVLGQGEAIRIMTGAPIPDGADAVVMVEDTERVGDGRVRIQARVPSRRGRAPGRRRRATRRPACSPPAPSVTPAVVGVLASVNARTVSALSARPRGACCRPATSWSRTAVRCGRARSARATAGCSPACCATRAARSSTSAPSPTTRRRSSRCCGAPPTSATRSSPAAACRWATTTSSRRCSAGSPT